MSETGHSIRPFAIVTGASTGIGLELAKQCAQDGYDLLIAADEAEIEAAADELRRFGGKVETLEADLATVEGVDQLIEAAAGRDVDALLANAGRGLGEAFLDQDFEEARRVVEGPPLHGAQGDSAEVDADHLGRREDEHRGELLRQRREEEHGRAPARQADGRRRRREEARLLGEGAREAQGDRRSLTFRVQYAGSSATSVTALPMKRAFAVSRTKAWIWIDLASGPAVGNPTRSARTPLAGIVPDASTCACATSTSLTPCCWASYANAGEAETRIVTMSPGRPVHDIGT